VVTKIGRQKLAGAQELVAVIQGKEVIDDTTRSLAYRPEDEVEILTTSVRRVTYKLVPKNPVYKPISELCRY